MKYVKLFFVSLLLAIVGHAVFLVQRANEHYMVGINDGLSQMTVFKQLLYEHYTAGEFFYSFSFGFGADIYSGLSYYFSTSFVFAATVALFFLLESIGLLSTPDALLWAQAAVFISTVRLTAVLFLTTLVFRYLKLSWPAAFIGAAIYGLSGMFFRHTVYWEFFADAYLWLPLLILGVEKIFRERAPGWFLAAAAISLIDNFYFAYINFLLTAIYILVRLFIPLAQDEIERKRALLLFLVTGLISFGISAVSFIPAVYAYLNNHRPSFEQDIASFDFADNILFTSRYIVLPAIFVLFLFVAGFYKNRAFRLFSILGFIGIVLHYSPLAASAFNGFSAPQYRWEYFLALVAGGAVAAAFDQLHKLTMRHVLLAVFSSACFYFAFLTADPDRDWSEPAFYVPLIVWALTATVLVLVTRYRKSGFKWILLTGTIAYLLLSVNLYQKDWLLESGNIEEVNEEMMTSSGFDDPEVRRLIEEIHAQADGQTYRIDWMEGVRNNTPIVQDFRGLSAYSSILNKNLLYFYLYDLRIDMGRESVSRYATLGNRTNLQSMMQGTYVIRENDDTQNVPYGFTEVLASDHYKVYENQMELPFVRSSSAVHTEEQLEDRSVLVREHAMLSGIVLDIPATGAPLPESDGTDLPFVLSEVGARFDGKTLQVTAADGGIDLSVQELQRFEGDFYVSFHLESEAADKGFNLAVNDYVTSRKSNASVYKTHVDDLTVRIPAAGTVEIRLPEGDYRLTDIRIDYEDYSTLQEAVQAEDGLRALELDGSSIQLTYDNPEAHDFAKIAIPYEKGWEASVNGEKVDVLKADYAMIGLPIEAGENAITLTYRPPFFAVLLLITVLSLLGSFFFLRHFRRSK